jgi:hypothetical protein
MPVDNFVDKSRFSVDNVVDKSGLSVDNFWVTDLSTIYPQGYPQILAKLSTGFLGLTL